MFRLCESVLNDIINERLLGHDLLPYQQEIDAHGGKTQVARELVAMITQHIKEMETQTVCRKQLDVTRLAQTTDTSWDSSMGYLSYITDDRDSRYFRLYVGQTACASRRIVSQHAQSILSGSSESLHHYIAFMGNGHRTVNFLRLWEFPKEDISPSELWNQIRSNILETVFCRAFRTHHGVLDSTNCDSDRQSNPY